MGCRVEIEVGQLVVNKDLVGLVDHCGLQWLLYNSADFFVATFAVASHQ